MRLLLSFVLLLCFVHSFAQNLVPNPGFEDYPKCPGSYSRTRSEFRMDAWYSPNHGTPIPTTPVHPEKAVCRITGQACLKHMREEVTLEFISGLESGSFANISNVRCRPRWFATQHTSFPFALDFPRTPVMPAIALASTFLILLLPQGMIRHGELNRCFPW